MGHPKTQTMQTADCRLQTVQTMQTVQTVQTVQTEYFFKLSFAFFSRSDSDFSYYIIFDGDKRQPEMRLRSFAGYIFISIRDVLALLYRSAVTWH